MYTHTINFNHMFKELKMPPGPSWCLTALLTHSNNGKSSMPISVLADMTGSSINSVKRYLKTLKEKSLITVAGKNIRFKNNIYRLSDKLYKARGVEQPKKDQDTEAPLGPNLATARAKLDHTIYNSILNNTLSRAHEDELISQQEEGGPEPKQQEPESTKEKITNINEVREVKRKFPMTEDFRPGESFPDKCKLRGVDYDALNKPFVDGLGNDNSLLKIALAEFTGYWTGEEGRHMAQSQWENTLINSLQRHPPKMPKQQKTNTIKQTAFTNRTGREEMSAEEFSRMNKLMSVIVPEPINFARLG